MSRAVAQACVITGLLASGPAEAQAVVTAVNGDPITTTDVDAYIKLLKLTRKAPGRSDALEAAIADHLKYDEARKWGTEFTDADFQSAITRLANQAKLKPEALVQAAQNAKVDIETLRQHLRSQAAWNVYVRNRNKGLGVTDQEISTQLAREGTGAKITDYDLREVVFVLPVKPTPADIESKTRAAQALRARFTDCETGLPLAKSLPEVAIKEPLSRQSSNLSQQMREVLADTPRGHLTNPQHSASGIEMIAVCNRIEDSGQTTLRERVQNEILQDKLQAESERMYREVRKAAIVSRN